MEELNMCCRLSYRNYEQEFYSLQFKILSELKEETKILINYKSKYGINHVKTMKQKGRVAELNKIVKLFRGRI